MKTLVVYYSRTGVTRKVAEAIQKELGCDLEEIIDRKDRKGPLGFIVSCKDAALKKETDIQPPAKNPQDYDLVIIGTPVWAGTMSCAVRTYVGKNKEAFRRVALFCTAGSSGIQPTFNHLEALCGKSPVAVLGLMTKEVAKEQFRDKVSEFIKSLSQ